MFLYNKYSNYLKEKYNEKVYKLPINLPLTCPNRDGTKGVGGCIFCSYVGAGFESYENSYSIAEQLQKNMDYIGKKYKAKKFIAYFQNFSNTYLPPIDFYNNLLEVTQFKNIVGISISTRPDCVSDLHILYAKKIKDEFNIDIMFELGLQSSNDNTLKFLNRGHSVKDFCDCANRIHKYNLEVGAHIILGLFTDTKEDVINTAKLLNEYKIDNVKCHSLYILKDTVLGNMYEKGEITLKSKDEFIDEVITFLCYLNKDCSVQRLLGRAPKEDTLFENWGSSWRKIQLEIENKLMENELYQGKLV